MAKDITAMKSALKMRRERGKRSEFLTWMFFRPALQKYTHSGGSYKLSQDSRDRLQFFRDHNRSVIQQRTRMTPYDEKIEKPFRFWKTFLKCVCQARE